MPNPVDLTGVTKGKLHFLEYRYSDPVYGRIWLCKCDCGNYLFVPANQANKNNSRVSCGCANVEERTARIVAYTKVNKPSNFKNLVGTRYGKLLVMERVGSTPNSGKGNSVCATWLCKCDCGGTIILSTKYLGGGQFNSCGCAVRDRQKLKNLGLSVNNPIYKVWCGVRSRCLWIKNNHYHNYGGRGITICDEWLNSFESFYTWSVDNGYQKGLQLDRIDNDGPYAPWNCRYITCKENSRNKRNNVMVEIENTKYVLISVLDQIGSKLATKTFKYRIQAGWPIVEAVFLPVLTTKQYYHRKSNPEFYSQLAQEKLNEFRSKQNQVGS